MHIEKENKEDNSLEIRVCYMTCHLLASVAVEELGTESGLILVFVQ